MFRTEIPPTSCTLCYSFAGPFNALWCCALAVPADCVTRPDCTQVTHFSLPAVPEVTAKVSREQKRCFVIQNLDSYQLINLGQTVTTKHGTVQSSHTQRCLQEKKAKLCIRQRWLNLACGKADMPSSAIFIFLFSSPLFSAFLGGNRRPCHHFRIFIAAS